MKQCIFIHIPRTAGSSIVEFAKEHSPSFQNKIAEFNDQAQFTDLKHRSPKWHLEKGHISQAWWDSSIKLAVARNPWDRLVSLYEYLKGFRLRRRFRQSNLYLTSFRAFAEEVTSGSKFVKPVGGANVRDFSQANPQMEWLGVPCVRILRFEDLHSDWKHFCHTVGFPNIELPHARPSQRGKDYRAYYTDQLAEQVGEFYKEDVNAFEYEFVRL